VRGYVLRLVPEEDLPVLERYAGGPQAAGEARPSGTRSGASRVHLAVAQASYREGADQSHTLRGVPSQGLAGPSALIPSRGQAANTGHFVVKR